MTAVELADGIVGPVQQAEAFQLPVTADSGFLAGKTMQGGVILQVLANSQIQIQGVLLEHNADPAHGLSRLFFQGLPGQQEFALLQGQQAGEQTKQG